MAGETVVILDDRFPHHDFEKEVFRDMDVKLVIDGTSRSESEVLSAARDADVLLVNLPPVTARVIAGLRKCRGIVRYGTGFDSVDIRAASNRNIRVVNVPDYCAEEVSDQVIGLWLGCIRQIPHRDRLVRQGGWDAVPAYPFRRIAGHTFGLLGYGRIARVLHRKLKGFELKRVLVNDPFVPSEQIRESGAEPVDFHTLLEESDYISIHTPLTNSTHHLFNADSFSRMKDGAIIINTARGAVIDPHALSLALRSGRLLAAGLDVHETEPLPGDSPLRELDNIVFSDHRGWYSVESTGELQRKCALAAKEILEGTTPEHTVNRALLKIGENA